MFKFSKITKKLIEISELKSKSFLDRDHADVCEIINIKLITWNLQISIVILRTLES